MKASTAEAVLKTLIGKEIVVHLKPPTGGEGMIYSGELNEPQNMDGENLWAVLCPRQGYEKGGAVGAIPESITMFVAEDIWTVAVPTETRQEAAEKFQKDLRDRQSMIATPSAPRGSAPH